MARALHVGHPRVMACITEPDTPTIPTQQKLLHVLAGMFFFIFLPNARQIDGNIFD